MSSEASIPIRVLAPAGASPEPAALASAAHALCDAGRTMEAETIARWLIHQHPQFSGARVLLGRVLFEQERLSEAADVLRATTIQYPASVAAYRWLAEVLVRQGLWARARAVLNQAAMLSPANRRIGQLQRLAGQSGERGHMVTDDSTTRAMNLAEAPRPPLPPIPAQGLSQKERRNRLTEEDPTPTGIAPPDTPLYARADFVPLAQSTPMPTAQSPRPAGRRQTAEWPAAAPRNLNALVPAYTESAMINVLQPPTGESTAVERTPPVTWQGIPLLDRHWRKRWPKGAALAAGLLATACVGFLSLKWLMVSPTQPIAQDLASTKHSSPRANASTLPSDLSDALMLATPASLRQALAKAQQMDAPGALVFGHLARTLLLVDYGVTEENKDLAIPTDWAQSLPAPLWDAAVAAQTLYALGHGKLEQARTLIQGVRPADAEAPWVPLAQARLLQRMGNLDAAREQLAPLPTDSHLVALLASELALDDGRPTEAMQMLAPLVAGTPSHPRLQRLVAQAQVALHAERAPAEFSCTADLLPNLLLDCQVQAASSARRAGQRTKALEFAAKANADAVTDPRALSQAVVAFANLGQVQLAKPFANRLNRFAQPAFSGRAWADLALALSAGPAGATGQIPDRAYAPETRLLASRAAYARGGTSALATTLAHVGTHAIGADDDLRWWRLLTRYENAAGMQVSSKLMRSRNPMGPVGTFVAGLLATNSRRLTSHWMSLALATPTHGDRCWAADLYAQAQKNLGVDPNRLPAYRSLMASSLCN